jgi:hypothetical protein
VDPSPGPSQLSRSRTGLVGPELQLVVARTDNFIGMKMRIPALLAVALLLVVACASRDDTQQPGSKPDRTTPVASKQTEEPPPIVATDCHSLLRDFLAALTELDTQVSAGLQFEDYGQQVGDIRVTFERIETSHVESDCLSAVQLPAERALNRYVEAYNIWNNCVGNGASCAEADVMPKLEAKWAEATSQIDAAETGLATLPGG